MINNFKSYSIDKKLMLAVSAAALFFMCFSLLVSTTTDVKHAFESADNELNTLADVVAINVATAIIKNDSDLANITLDAFQAENIVMQAKVLDADGMSFATYNNLNHHDIFWRELFSTGHLIVERPIMHDNKIVGTIHLVADRDKLVDSIVLRLAIKVLGFIAAYVIGYFFLNRMVKKIFEPVEQLTEAMHEVVDDQRYSLRVEQNSTDAFGRLIDGFNQMLGQIESKNSQLHQSDKALSQTQEAIALYDENTFYQYVNPAFTVMFGYHLDELKGKRLSTEEEKVKEVDGLSCDEIFAIARNNGSYRGEITRVTKAGKIVPTALTVSPILDDKAKLTGYVAVYLDISEKKQTEERMWKQANFDLLTGLPNRYLFHDRLEREIQNSRRRGESFALMFLDLDNFKEVNDSLGHDVGDLLLKEAASRLARCLRVTDTLGLGHDTRSGDEQKNSIARLGGDEFTVILSDYDNEKNIDLVAQRILNELEKPFSLGVDIVSISASIGITVFPEDAVDVEDLIKNADQTMYHAKDKGRNTYSYFTTELNNKYAKRRDMVVDLHIAIDENQFVLVYQPIVDLRTNKIEKAEALIRWQHPKKGLINPVDFIPVAEESGQIVAIGNWVFFEAIKQLDQWRKSIDKNFQVSINKSPAQFYKVDKYHENWFETMKSLNLSGSNLVIEITEGLMLNQNPEVSDKLLAFREKGIQIAVDDFGTGYSSLSYLKKLDVDYIKIDRSFIQNLSLYSDDMVLCEAMITMAHKLGLKVIAEGVETIEQRNLLTTLDCDYGQGYLFSKPVLPGEFEKLNVAQNKLKDNRDA